MSTCLRARVCKLYGPFTILTSRARGAPSWVHQGGGSHAFAISTRHGTLKPGDFEREWVVYRSLSLCRRRTTHTLTLANG